jgi:hypothetical protein
MGMTNDFSAEAKRAAIEVMSRHRVAAYILQDFHGEQIGADIKSGPLSVPREHGPDLISVPNVPEVGATTFLP